MNKGINWIAVILISLLGACSPTSQEVRRTAPEAPLTPAAQGGLIFRQNCSTCHNLKFDGTGPSLAGVLDRWNQDTARMKAYIRNPSKMIESGDPEAQKAYEKFKPTLMTPFPGLSDEALNQLLAYLKENGG